MNINYIASLRNQNNLNQSELGNKIGVTRQTIAAWEQGERQPSFGQVALMARVFRVPIEVFLEPSAEPVLLFRAEKSELLSPLVKDLIIAKATLYRQIEEIVGESSGLSMEQPMNGYDFTEVEYLAQKVRNSLGIATAPLGDVIRLVEDRGIKVMIIDLPQEVSGFSAFTSALGSVVVVNKNQPVERQFFTVLHELAHLICHRKDFLYPKERSKKEQKEQEKLANHFASAVLLPREVLEHELRLYRSWIPEPMLKILKRRYSVSMRTILVRARDLGIIPKKEAGAQIGKLNNDYGKYDEPVQLERCLSAEEPDSRFERLVFQALGKGDISMSKAAEALGESLLEVRKKARLWIELQGSAL